MYGKQKAMILYKEVFEAKAAHLCGRSTLPATAVYSQRRLSANKSLMYSPLNAVCTDMKSGEPLWQDSNFVQILCSSDFWPRALTYAVPGVAFDDDSASFERVSYTFQKNHLIFFFHYFTSLFQGKSRYFCRIISNHILSYPTIWS